MKSYKSNGNSQLVIEQREAEERPKVKIKVTHIMPTYSDINIFAGTVKQNYPFIFGHIAIGVVSDDREEYGLKRGTKVILNPYIVEASDRLDIAGKVKTRGVDVDGFLQDFVFLDVEDITPFPEGVDEEEAIFTEKIALAMSTINSFSVEKGDYMVIVGGSPMCNILAQLAIYFQLIPIMIDTNPHWLEKAKKCGVYYTIDETKDVPYDMVKEITGGRMAEHTVIEATADVTTSYFLQLAREGGDCTVICENKIVKKLDVDISQISKRQLKLKGVSNGAKEFDSAINILAQKILNLDDFIEETVDIADAEEHLRYMQENFEEHYSMVIKV